SHLDPSLKSVLDKLEKREKGEPTVLLTVAVLFRQDLANANAIDKILQAQRGMSAAEKAGMNVALQTVKEVRAVGASLSALTEDRAGAMLAIEAQTDAGATTLYQG